MNYLSQTQPEQFKGKRVIYRVDFNVPVENGEVTDAETFRIHAVFPTLDFLKGAGAKIILISHIGQKGESLQPVADYINENLPEWNVEFIPEVVGDSVKDAVDSLQDGHCILLENVRTDPREETNDPEFAKELASYADYYVEDAFGVMHRAHASLVGVPKLLPSYAGFLLEKEINNLGLALKPQSPSVLIMAGIKFETKLPLIEKLLPLYDHVILGGGLLNTYLHALGMEIGASVLDGSADLSSILGNTKIIVPEKVVTEENDMDHEMSVSEVLSNDTIMDVVIDDQMKKLLTEAKTVVWNGPLGWYEKGYMQSTLDIVANLGSQTHSIVGGGDTVTVIRKEGLENKITFLSTGGGAMLEYLQNGTLVGLEALK